MVLLPTGPQSTEIDDIAHQLSMQRDEINRVSASLSGIQQGQDWEFDFLRAKTAEFDTIPHPAASVTVLTGTSHANSTTFSSFVGWTSASGAAWAFSVNWVSSEGIINPSNQPEESIWRFDCWIHWAGSSVGRRGLKWIETGGAGSVESWEFSPSSAEDTWLYINHVRRAGSGDKAYELYAMQNSGSSLAMTQALMVATRVR